MSVPKDGPLASATSPEPLLHEKKDAEEKGKRSDKAPRPSKETKEHRIILYVPDRVYNLMVHRAYQRQQRIEQLAEEILIARFSE